VLRMFLSGATFLLLSGMHFEAVAAPSPPSAVSAYSDHTTPSSIQLSWTDPTVDEFGGPAGAIDIRVRRAGAPEVVVPRGVEAFVVAGLLDRTFYTFDLVARDSLSGEESPPVTVAWHAGGHPVPGAISNLSVVPGTFTLQWTHSATQADGTPLDDLGGVSIYKNGVFFARQSRPRTFAGQPDSWTDPSPPPGPLSYQLAAYDREVPTNEGALSNVAIAVYTDPTIVPVTSAVSASLAPGETKTAPIDFRNMGHPSLLFSTAEGAPWMSLTPISGSVASRAVQRLTVTFTDAGLPGGTYRDTVDIATNDPVTPLLRIPVQLVIVESELDVIGGPLALSTTWEGGRDTLDLAVSNSGTGYLQVNASESGGWLQVSPAAHSVTPSTSELFRLIADPSGLPPGLHVATLRLTTNDRDEGIVDLEVRFEVLAVPATFVLESEQFSMRAGVGSAARFVHVQISNPGSEPLVFSTSSQASWIDVPPGPHSVPPGGAGDIRLQLDPSSRAVGAHASTVRFTGNDPMRPMVDLAIELDVLPSDAAAIVIEELGLRCEEIDPSNQFIELRALAAAEFDADLRVELRDARGHLLAPTASIGEPATGSDWPAGRSWLLAPDSFQSSSGLSPDRTLPYQVDPEGGVVVLIRDGASPTLVAELVYGEAGGVPAPSPGRSLLRTAGGLYVETPAAEPRNFAGATMPGSGCACPANDLWWEFTGSLTTATALDSSVEGFVYEGRINYDLSQGTASCEARSGMTSAILRDVFVLEAPDAGAPWYVVARLDVTGRLVAGTFEGSGVEAAAILRSGLEDAAATWFANTGSSLNIGETLVLPILAVPDQPFVLEVELRVNTGSHGGTGRLGGSTPIVLSFSGLPPGAVLRSCQGFVVEAPVPLDLALLDSRAGPGWVSLTWKGDLQREPVRIERFMPSGEWVIAGHATPDADGTIRFEERGLMAGAYRWRLAFSGGYGGEVHLVIASDGSRPVLGSWQASTNRLLLDLVLPREGPASIDVYDVAGRRRVHHAFGPLPAGRWSGELPGAEALASGIYFLRAFQGAGAFLGGARVVIVR
jgi:hypothetical protein